MAAPVIKTRTISLVTDNRAVLNNGTFVRPIQAGQWNKLRVCLRFSVTISGAHITSPPAPHFAFGLCSGSSNIFTDAVNNQFVGIITCLNPILMAYFAGPPAGYSARHYFGTKIGGVYTGTDGPAGFATNYYQDGLLMQYDGTSGPQRSFCVCDITRPGGMTLPTSGQYTLAMFLRTGTVSRDVSSSEFLSNSILTTPAITQHTMYAPATQNSVFVNENTHGPLDNISISWDRSDIDIEISDVGYVKLL